MGLDFNKICREVIQNYPEYSTEYMMCTKWKYGDKMEFSVEDPNKPFDNERVVFSIGDNESCTHSFDDMANALRKLCHMYLDNKFYAYGWAIHDDGTYDLTVLDAIMQLTFLDEIVFG